MNWKARMFSGLGVVLLVWAVIIRISYWPEFQETLFPGFRPAISLGFSIMLLGGVLNFIAVWVNGGKMPVVIEGTDLKIPSDDFIHCPTSAETRFWFLIDRIPVKSNGRTMAMRSLGDVLFKWGDSLIMIIFVLWLLNTWWNGL